MPSSSTPSSSRPKTPSILIPDESSTIYTSAFEAPTPRSASNPDPQALSGSTTPIQPSRPSSSTTPHLSSRRESSSRKRGSSPGFPVSPRRSSGKGSAEQDPEDERLDERGRPITMPHHSSSSTSPLSPSGAHNVDININGVPYLENRKDGLGMGTAASALMRASSDEYLAGSEDRRGSNPVTPLMEADFSPISTTFSSRIPGVSGSPPLSGGELGPVYPSRRGYKMSSLGRSFLANNPVTVAFARSYLRGVSTLIVWALAAYTLTKIILPAEMHESLHSTITKFRLPSSSSMSHDAIASLSSSYLLPPHFPAPPARPGDSFASPDPRYRAYKPLDRPPSPFPRLRRTKMLPQKCLEGWFLNGETLYCTRQELGEEETLDVTWLWVNGSDTRWKEDLHKWREGQGVISPDHHFRENNELKYSIRSVLAALPGHLRTFHLILADFPFSSVTDMALINQASVQELETAAKKDPTPVNRWTKSGKAPVEVVAEDSQVLAKKAGKHRIMVEVDQDVGADHLINAQSEEAQERRKAKIPPAMSNKLSEWLSGLWRVVQTPTWLAFDMMDLSDPQHPLHKLHISTTASTSHTHITSHPSLRYASHWEIFHTPTHLKNAGDADEAIGAAEWREKQWKSAALPTFNSMSIESRIGWLWGLADVSLSMNDDFFLLREHAVSDFYSPLYGTVIRFDGNYNSQVRPALSKAQVSDPGESGGLFHANFLLSQRFPRRLRQYFAHVPKVITRGLHHEASIMFEDALTESSKRKFREVRTGDGDIQMQWLLTSLRVERWREALLWTWIVGRVGTAPQWMAEERGEVYSGPVDFWGADARADVRALFGLTETDTDVVKIEVHKGERWTLEKGRMEEVFANAGWEAPKATDMLFSSMDGHLPYLTRPNQPDESQKCLFDLDRCFGSFWSRDEEVSSDEMFKRLAFVNPTCGDCLVMALVTSSGPLGLSAVFPPKSATFTNPRKKSNHPDDYLPPPHLPLTPTWAEADFSLESVVSETSLPGEKVELRLWSMQLLSRYLYLSGRSDSHFHMLVGAKHASGVFKLLDGNRHVSVLGMNDDIISEYEETRDMMLSWFESRWKKPAVWEKGWTLEQEKEVNDLL